MDARLVKTVRTSGFEPDGVPPSAVKAVIYLRLSDLRLEDLDDDGGITSMPAREKALRDLARRLGWDVVDVVIENDISPRTGRVRPASAFKRRPVVLADGTTDMRVYRPGFRSIMDAFRTGRYTGLLAEDLDRTFRDPQDLEDFVKLVEAKKGNARSLSGSLTLTDGGTDSEITMARVMVAMANKSSRDTSRRVADSRQRKADAGQFGGGKRPFGFEKDGITIRKSEAKLIKEHSLRLLQVPAEGEKAVTLRLLTRELIDADVPTVTGAQWSSKNWRGILIRPRNAGILTHRGQEMGEAPWDPIVEEPIFRAVVRLLTDPDRRTNRTGSAPKWLGSGLWLCGVCDDGTTMQVTNSQGHAPRYWCRRRAHLTRNVAQVDEIVISRVLGKLASADAAELLLSTPKPGIDVAGLRAEAKSIREELDSMAADRALKLITREQMIKATAVGQQRISEIDELLRAEINVDSPLAPLIGAPDIVAAWERMPLASKRAVISDLVKVTILPVGHLTPRRHALLDPKKSVRVEVVK